VRQCFPLLLRVGNGVCIGHDDPRADDLRIDATVDLPSLSRSIERGVRHRDVSADATIDLPVERAGAGASKSTSLRGRCLDEVLGSDDAPAADFDSYCADNCAAPVMHVNQVRPPRPESCEYRQHEGATVRLRRYQLDAGRSSFNAKALRSEGSRQCYIASALDEAAGQSQHMALNACECRRRDDVQNAWQSRHTGNAAVHAAVSDCSRTGAR
jgi:hypothetical protein